MATKLTHDMSVPAIADELKATHYAIRWTLQRLASHVQFAHLDADDVDGVISYLRSAEAALLPLVPNNAQKCARCNGEMRSRLSVTDKDGNTLVIHNKRDCMRSGDMLA